MATIELRLNSKKPGNYAFFCPVTKIHLTIANPVGFANRVSNYILRGLKSKTLIDVNGVIDLETGNVADVNRKEEVKVPESKEPAQVPVTQEPEESSQGQEVGAEEVKTEETQSEEVKEKEKVEETQPNTEETQSETEEKNETVEESTEAEETKKRGRRAQK